MDQSNLHIIRNGEILLSNEPLFTSSNRAFCYGDAVFESMHATGSEIHFAAEHFHRLFSALEILKMKAEFNAEKLLKDIKRLINRDKLFGGVRIRLEVYRDAEGLYTPQSQRCSYVISCQPLQYPNYYLNQKGLTIGIFEELKKPIHPISSFKTASSLLNVMAGMHARESNLDDCLILNENGQIIEGYHSNIFLVKNEALFTPSVNQGCVNGVMRAQIIKLAQNLGLKVSENIIVNENLLPEADEIFLTNAIEGIRWVLAYKNRRYFNKISKLLMDKLNESIALK